MLVLFLCASFCLMFKETYSELSDHHCQSTTVFKFPLVIMWKLNILNRDFQIEVKSQIGTDKEMCEAFNTQVQQHRFVQGHIPSYMLTSLNFTLARIESL